MSAELRRALVEHPAVLSVGPPQPVFRLERLARPQGRFEPRQAPLQILRVDYRRPPFRQGPLQTAAGETQPLRVK